MELLVDVYRVARVLPGHELYAMSDQLRRSVVSVPSNIAEGYARVHRGDYVHHLSIARGSLAEVETLLDAAVAVGYTDDPGVAPAWRRADEVRRMLSAMIVRLRE